MDDKRTSHHLDASPVSQARNFDGTEPPDNVSERGSGLNRQIKRLKAAFRNTPLARKRAHKQRRLQDRKVEVSHSGSRQNAEVTKPRLSPKTPAALQASLAVRVGKALGEREDVRKDFFSAATSMYKAAIEVAMEGVAEARAGNNLELARKLESFINENDFSRLKLPETVTDRMLEKQRVLPRILKRRLERLGLDKEVVKSSFNNHLNRPKEGHPSDVLSARSTHDHKELFKLQLLQIAAAMDVISAELSSCDQPATESAAELRRLNDDLRHELRRMRRTVQLNGDAHVSKQEMKAAKEEFPTTLKARLVKAGVGPEVIKSRYQQAFAKRLNNRRWQPVRRSFEFHQQRFRSSQIPAASMKARDGKGLFVSNYHGKGVSCVDTKNGHHATNLWRSEFETDGKKVFAGIRHGIHDPYGEKDKVLRLKGAKVKAEESVLGALAARPEIYELALKAGAGATRPPVLLTTSTSLVTTGVGSAKERRMQRMQDKAFAALVKAKQPITLYVPGEGGSLRKVTFRLRQPSLNIPVNWGGVGFASIVTGGRKYQRKKNSQAMGELFGKRNRKTRKRTIGLVQEYRISKKQQIAELKKKIRAYEGQGMETGRLYNQLAEIERELRIVRELSRQIRQIYTHGRHFHEHHDAYKLAARVVLLTYKIGGVPLYNCKSGKDRTGMLDAEVKFLAARIERDKKVPQPGKIKSAEDRALFRRILLESGNHEVQEYNVGVRGYKTEGVSSIDKRVDDAQVREEVRGLSKTVGS